MRPILGQKQYNALDTDFEVVAQAYNTLQTKHGNLEKAREVADLDSSVAELQSENQELQSENELLHCVVEETSEENKQLKDRIKELLEQQKSQTKR
jgi:predicted nuclease with TOPRIM domain